MNYADIRKKLNLSQSEIAILFGVPTVSIKNWELDSHRPPDSAAITLYKLVSGGDEDVRCALVMTACEKQYTDLSNIQVLKKLIAKLVPGKLERSILEVIILKSNTHWKPEELGFRITTINL